MTKGDGPALKFTRHPRVSSWPQKQDSANQLNPVLLYAMGWKSKQRPLPKMDRCLGFDQKARYGRSSASNLARTQAGDLENGGLREQAPILRRYKSSRAEERHP